MDLAAEDTCRLYAGANDDRLICGRDFEIAGNIITLDLSGPSVFVGKRSDEEIQSSLQETVYYESLPLDALTLIEEIPVTDEYKYSLGNRYGILEITENTTFDENGIHYVGIGKPRVECKSASCGATGMGALLVVPTWCLKI